MKKLFFTLCFLIVSQMLAQTIDFESTGYYEDQQLGQSVTISGFIFAINSTPPDDILFGKNDASRPSSNVLYDDNVNIGGITMWTISRDGGSELQLKSLYIKDAGFGSTSGTIKAFKDGAQVGSTVNINFDGNKDFSSNSDFWDIDEIRIEATDINFFIDDLVYGGVLPVELTTFSATIENGKVKLNWETATEINNYGFDVERKTETVGWTKIGFVAGHGNSNSPKQYEFIDEDAPAEELEYRLKQIDTDGAFEYYHITAKIDASSVTDVEDGTLPTEFALEQNYPNPFNPTTKISYSIPQNGQVQIKVYDMLGNEIATLVNEQKQVGNYEVNFDASNLSSGVYLYKIVSGNYLETKKMVLLR